LYEKYWGLKELPFENVPDPRFMYYSPDHEEALTRLIYATERRKGAVMLTGEVGCGKTTLSRVFIKKISTDDHDIALIANPSLTPIDFLAEILYQLGIENKSQSKTDLLHALNEKMLKNVKADRDTVIIIDEAQVIKEKEIFEELRLLLNFQLNDRFLLTLIMIGQPELKEQIESIPQLEQRIAIKYHLKPLNLEQTTEYIFFRLKTAGMTKNIFSKEAIDQIYKETKGVPRKINNLCDLSLLVGCTLQLKVIDSKTVNKVIEDRK
jgi:general secretion pathway protein A